MSSGAFGRMHLSFTTLDDVFSSSVSLFFVQEFVLVLIQYSGRKFDFFLYFLYVCIYTLHFLPFIFWLSIIGFLFVLLCYFVSHPFLTFLLIYLSCYLIYFLFFLIFCSLHLFMIRLWQMMRVLINWLDCLFIIEEKAESPVHSPLLTPHMPRRPLLRTLPRSAVVQWKLMEK